MVGGRQIWLGKLPPLKNRQRADEQWFS